MIDGFGANVCANCQFFLSHKVLSTFLDTEGSIDDSNESKRSVKGLCNNVDTLLSKVLRHLLHKILHRIVHLDSDWKHQESPLSTHYSRLFAYYSKENTL